MIGPCLCSVTSAQATRFPNQHDNVPTGVALNLKETHRKTCRIRNSLPAPHHPTFTFTFTPTRISTNPSKMLYLVGLGLSNEKDITIAGLEVVQKASRVYLEAYTSILMIEKDKLVSKHFLLPLSSVANHRLP